MKLSTMAAVMSFVSKIENEGAAFLATHAEKHPALRDNFISWGKEDKCFEKQMK